MMRRWFPAALLAALALIAAPEAATRPNLASSWRLADIVIDGADFEWTDTLAEIPTVPASLSVTNDQTHVYVRVRVTDPATIQQVVRGGLIVWFDPRGGDDRTFGIKYPVGTPPPNPDADGRTSKPGDDGTGARRGGPPPRSQRSGARGAPPIEDLRALIPNRLEIHGPKDDDIRSLVLAYATGLSVALTIANNALVYELRVPLARDADHPYAIGSAAGATVGFGVQSLKIATAGGGLLAGLAGGGMGGGMSGGRPGGGGRPAGGPPPDRADGEDRDRKPPAPPKPFNVWQTLTLAKM